jgi:hypothetical protein
MVRLLTITATCFDDSAQHSGDRGAHAGPRVDSLEATPDAVRLLVAQLPTAGVGDRVARLPRALRRSARRPRLAVGPADGRAARCFGAFMLCLRRASVLARLLTPIVSRPCSRSRAGVGPSGLAGVRPPGLSASAGAAILSGGWTVAVLSLFPVLDAGSSTPDFQTGGSRGAARVGILAAVVVAGSIVFHLPPRPALAGNSVAALAGLLLGMAPWTLLLPALLAFLAQRSAAVAQLRQPALGYFLLCAGWAALLALVSGNARYPRGRTALALALGATLTPF